MRLLRRLTGLILFAAYMWGFWELYRRFLGFSPQELRYWAAMAACFILLGFGAWLFDRIWPPKRSRPADVPPAPASPGDADPPAPPAEPRGRQTAVPVSAARPHDVH